MAKGRPTTFIEAITPISESEYTQSHPELMLRLMTEGKLNMQVIAALGLKKDTFYRWIREHEDFKTAYEIGRCRAEAYWAQQLQDMTIERNDKGCKACIMILNNNFGWGKDEMARTQVQNTINIQGNMNVIQQKSQEELIELIQNNTEYLQLNNVLAPQICLPRVLEGEVVPNGSNKQI